MCVNETIQKGSGVRLRNEIVNITIKNRSDVNQRKVRTKKNTQKISGVCRRCAVLQRKKVEMKWTDS